MEAMDSPAASPFSPAEASGTWADKVFSGAGKRKSLAEGCFSLAEDRIT